MSLVHRKDKLEPVLISDSNRS